MKSIIINTIIFIIIIIIIVLFVVATIIILKKNRKSPNDILPIKIPVPPPPSPCPEFVSIPNTNLSNFNMTSITNPINADTEKECQLLCQKYNCDLYNYESDSHSCWLKEGSNNGNYITGLKVINPSSECLPYTRLVGKNLPGYNLPEYNKDNYTEKQCQEDCTNNMLCNFYNYEMANGKCYISNIPVEDNINTGFKQYPKN